MTFGAEKLDRKNIIEEVFGDVIETCFTMPSPATGEMISAIRLTDLYKILCEKLEVNQEDTCYKEYIS